MPKKNKGEDYEVGYRKPPKETQFKKGQSGNPKGRPKGSVNFIQSMEIELAKPIVISTNGKQEIVTKIAAIAKQLTNKAAMGDMKAMPHLMKITEKIAMEHKRQDELVNRAMEEMSDAELIALIKESGDQES
jgi:hypothetical protein